MLVCFAQRSCKHGQHVSGLCVVALDNRVSCGWKDRRGGSWVILAITYRFQVRISAAERVALRWGAIIRVAQEVRELE
ncbi:hypothetical protein D3C81_1521480 [compost metagenome]